MRNEIREKIETELKSFYPMFESSNRSRRPTADSEEISLFVDELQKIGYKSMRRYETIDLADVNQLARHLPESFKMEVKRKLPKISAQLLDEVVDSSVRKVIKGRPYFGKAPIANELFLVCEKFCS